jgi:energy-coupling factor transport system substrate-specific component
MKSSTRTVLFAVVIGALTLVIYYLAAVVRGPEAELARWKTVDAILTANLALVFGLLFLGWGITIWKLVSIPPLKASGLRDLFYGFWFIAAIVVPYIIRKPGAAVAAETLAAAAEWLAGGEWGLTLLISGLVQGGAAELIFAATGWTNYRLPVLMLAGAAAGVGSFVVDYLFWYSTLAPGVLAVMFVARFISGGILSGWLGKALSDALAGTGVLASFPLGRERRRPELVGGQEAA